MPRTFAIAKTPGTCGRCAGSINAGHVYLWSNLHKRRYHFKADDGSCRVGLFPGDMPEPTDLTAVTPTTTVDDASNVHDDVEAVETPTAPGNDLAAMIAAAVAPMVRGTIDADAVRKIARDVARECATGLDRDAVAAMIADRLRPTAIEVKRVDGSTVTVDGAHYLMPRLLKLLGAGIHVYLWGPAGSGKTTAALQALAALGMGGEIDTLDPSTPKSAVMGYRTPNGEPVQTAFTRCYGSDKHGYIADECDNAPAHVQTLFNSALANGHAPFAWGSVARGDGFAFVGTGNTPGRPTPAFPDRRPMSAAFADRLYFMHWPLDPAIECRAAGLPVPAAPKRTESTVTAAQWVTWVQTVRSWAAQNAPTLMVTPRASLTGLQALQCGETPLEVAHGLVFRGADDALVSKVLAAVPLA